MKTIKISTGDFIKVTKREIKQFLSLERCVSTYQHLDGNTLAYAVAFHSEEYFRWEGTDSIEKKVNDVYRESEAVLEYFIAHQLKCFLDYQNQLKVR